MENKTRSFSEGLTTRWQQLFHYIYAEAIDRLKQHRSNLSRERVPDEHWEMVRCVKEAQGYDREAYEHEIELERRKRLRTSSGLRTGPSVNQACSKSVCILKLEGLLDTASKVPEAADLDVLPVVTTGTGGLGEASFATIDNAAKEAIAAWCCRQRTHFVPTFIRISKSGKDLSEHPMWPTLGVDSTLPQYRADSVDSKFLPNQNQYPVWYFFYGNLAVPHILTRRLALLEEPIFVPATVKGGVIKMWRDRHRALLDSVDTACVDGWAYHVATEEHEEVLRSYETELYQVVRCTIFMKDNSGSVHGLTFKFVGPSEHLT